MSVSSRQSEDAQLELVLPSALYDNWIKDEFPYFQTHNRRMAAATLCISFAQCEWVSPFPVLAIITEIMSYSDSGRTVKIDLGNGAGTDRSAELRWRSLKYLALHGFLNGFLGRPDVHIHFQFDRSGEHGEQGYWYENREGLIALRAVLDRSHVELIYGDLIVIPATVWQLPNKEHADLTAVIRAKVNELLRHADTVLFKFKTESRKYRDVTLQRLNQVLLELVENAAEHAYADDMAGFVGLYARVRQTNSERAVEARKRELHNSPLLRKILLSEKQQLIEVFVVDVGKGLFFDMRAWEGNIDFDQMLTYPLRESAAILFKQPLSRHSRKKENISHLRGGSTGLVHLDSILRHQNDSTRIITGKEWIAGIHPRPPGFKENAASTGGYITQSFPLLGTFFHLGISPSVIPALKGIWFCDDHRDSNKIKAEIVRKFAKSQARPRLESEVIDIRSGEGLESMQNRVHERASKSSGTIVRVNRIAEKNMVNRIVISWIQGVAKSNKTASTLFLCDLGRFQAIDIVWVIEHLFPVGQRIELARKPGAMLILLVTEDLCCTSISVTCRSRHDGTFLVDIGKPTAQVASLENRLVYLLEELRIRDSIALWARAQLLSGKQNPNPVLLEDVLWSAESAKVLPFYLNFAVLIQDEDAARSIRRALRRLLALFPHAHTLALDALVGASLHDALKWLIAAPLESLDRVLVGSMSVSGSTLKRFLTPLNTRVVAVVDCIRTPYFGGTVGEESVPHLAALLWDPALATSSDKPPQYQRVGRSAYVEKIRATTTEVAYDDALYDELESSRLIKVGHWAHGDSHGLVEINTYVAIDQSGASESGAITWLVKQLNAILLESSVVLAFPVNRLAYRLAHHIRSRIKGAATVNGEKLILLPLSYMPRMAGGLARFAPLVMDAARELSKPAGGERRTAVFLDYGFIANRTSRHSVRQLRDAGFGDIRSLGLLNRSSAPELASEVGRVIKQNHEFPLTYWRWNVPTLGMRAHCPICAAMPSFGRLGRIVSETHVDLVSMFDAITHMWRARDIGDAWEEFGLAPLPLSKTVIDKLDSLLKQMRIKEVYSSSTLAARLIEYLRATGDIDMPFRLCAVMMDEREYALAVELLCVVILLASDGLSDTDMQDYIGALLTCSVMLGVIEPAFMIEAKRQTCLLGLVMVVFSLQSQSCKLALVPQVATVLGQYHIVNATALRLALIALTTDSDVSSDVKNSFEKLCIADKNHLTLLSNYHALRPGRGTACESVDKLTQAFGRSVWHSQQSEFGTLQQEFTRSSKPAMSLPRLRRLASLIAQCDKNFLMSMFGLDSDAIINNIHALEHAVLYRELDATAFKQELASTLDGVSAKLHSTLVRYGEPTEFRLIYTAFYTMLMGQTSANALVWLQDIVPTRNAATQRWPEGVGDYFLLGEQVARLFGEIFNNIKSKSAKLAPPKEQAEFVGLEASALAWFWFDLKYEPPGKGITVVIVTGLASPKAVTPYHPKVTGLADFGVMVSSAKLSEHYFEIRVRIPSLASILEAA